jgi:hypothetical protein
MALAANIEAVRRLVTELARDVEAGAKPKGKKGDGAGPLSWLDMAGTNRDPAQVLIEVADFLEAVYLRYTDGAKSFPDCWLWHPDLEHHKPGGKVHGPALRAPHRDAIPEISAWWATHRRGPGPAPTDAQLAEADKTARRR